MLKERYPKNTSVISIKMSYFCDVLNHKRHREKTVFFIHAYNFQQSKASKMYFKIKCVNTETNRKSHYSSYQRYHCKAILGWLNLQSGFLKPFSIITLIFLLFVKVNAGNINATENSFIQEGHMVIWPLKVSQGLRHQKLIGPFSSFCSHNCGNSTVVCHMYMPGSCHNLWQA